MSIETTILKASNNLQQGGMFESHTQTIELFIRDCQASPTITSAFLVQEFLADITKSYGVLAVAGTAFKTSNDSGWDNYLPNTEFGEWRVRNVNVRPDQDKNAFRVTVTQTNMGMMYSTAETPTFIGSPSVSVNRVSRTRNVNAWRADPEMWPEELGLFKDPGEGTKGWGAILNNCSTDWAFCSTGRDIEGTSIDINGGQATQFNIGQEQITIEFLARSPYVDALDETKNDAQWTYLYWLQNLLNTRNAEEWFGFAPGYLLVVDIAIQPMHHEFKRVTMTLLYDKWKHASQRPWVTKTGIVAYTNSCPATIDPPDPDIGDPLVNLTASVVGWLQPYQTLGSFGTDPEELFPQFVFQDAWLKLGGNTATNYTPAVEGNCGA